MRTVCRHQKMDCAFTRPQSIFLGTPLVGCFAERCPQGASVVTCGFMYPADETDFETSGTSSLCIFTVSTACAHRRNRASVPVMHCCFSVCPRCMGSVLFDVL